jgi:branched-chain amino acid transport system substrate-binding protein
MSVVKPIAALPRRFYLQLNTGGYFMRFKPAIIAVALSLLFSSSLSAAAEPLKIGFMTTLSGPAASVGKHMQDGFNLYLKLHGNKLGGRDVSLITVDDELKPDVAVTRAQALIERDKVDFVTGIIFSNVLAAVLKPVTNSETFLISANAGPSVFAGKGCNPFFFNVSWQNDTVPEAMGKYLAEKGPKQIAIITPNYQAGKDMVAGFKRYYKGEIVDEIYTQLNQLDFSAEIARIAALKPEGLFTFMPGGMGVSLIKQYSQAGLSRSIPFYSVFVVDETTLPATKDAALGLLSTIQYAPTLDNESNRIFAPAFEKEFGYVPSYYASQAYDAAQLIDSALAKTGGATDDKNALREALESADFKSVRGDFRFNVNHFPIQDYYLVKAVKRADGAYMTEVVEKVLDDHGDAYASQCEMK